MDLTGQEIHFIGYLSSAKDTLQRGKAVIGLAEIHPPNAKTLAACACVLLAAALEQAVRTKFSEAAEIIVMEESCDFSKTTPAMYLDNKRASAISRVRSLPGVLTNGHFRLAPKHEMTLALEELIETRNRLTHVDEPAIHLIGPNDQVEVLDHGIKVTFVRPPNPWSRVTIEKVKTFERAVDYYFAEIIFPESGKIIAGTIVTPAH
jgi:hypothetical protein